MGGFLTEGFRGKNQESRIKNQESRTKNQEPRIKNQESRTKNQESRTKNQEPRIKNQEPSLGEVLVRTIYFMRRQSISLSARLRPRCVLE